MAMRFNRIRCPNECAVALRRHGVKSIFAQFGNRQIAKPL